MSHPALSATTLVQEVLASYPQAAAVLEQFSIHACCHGEMTLEQASAVEGHDAAQVVGHLAAAIFLQVQPRPR